MHQRARGEGEVRSRCSMLVPICRTLGTARVRQVRQCSCRTTTPYRGVGWGTAEVWCASQVRQTQSPLTSINFLISRFSSLPSTSMRDPAESQNLSMAMILALSPLFSGSRSSARATALPTHLEDCGLCRHLSPRMTAATLSKSEAVDSSQMVGPFPLGDNADVVAAIWAVAQVDADQLEPI